MLQKMGMLELKIIMECFMKMVWVVFVLTNRKHYDGTVQRLRTEMSTQEKILNFCKKKLDWEKELHIY